MTSKARPLAAALAGVALAASAPAALADQPKNPVQGVPASAPAPGKTACRQHPRCRQAAEGLRPGALPALHLDQFTQTRGSVACPIGTVAYGGGVVSPRAG